jgi:hypothetical protein
MIVFIDGHPRDVTGHGYDSIKKMQCRHHRIGIAETQIHILLAHIKQEREKLRTCGLIGRNCWCETF